MSDEPKTIAPVIILPVDEISKDDIAELRKNGFCVVEAKDPSKVRFMEPPPNGYTEQERAAIALCRKLLASPSFAMDRRDVAAMLADFFIKGSPLDSAARVEAVPEAPRRLRKS